jgi:hypothetical protein
MTTTLIISASLLISAIVLLNIKLYKENRSLLFQNDLIESNYLDLKKKYDFITKCEKRHLKLIDILTEKANKYDAELSRQRIKNANYRAKKQQSKK